MSWTRWLESWVNLGTYDQLPEDVRHHLIAEGHDVQDVFDSYGWADRDPDHHGLSEIARCLNLSEYEAPQEAEPPSEEPEELPYMRDYDSILNAAEVHGIPSVGSVTLQPTIETERQRTRMDINRYRREAENAYHAILEHRYSAANAIRDLVNSEKHLRELEELDDGPEVVISGGNIFGRDVGIYRNVSPSRTTPAIEGDSFALVWVQKNVPISTPSDKVLVPNITFWLEGAVEGYFKDLYGVYCAPPGYAAGPHFSPEDFRACMESETRDVFNRLFREHKWGDLIVMAEHFAMSYDVVHRPFQTLPAWAGSVGLPLMPPDQSSGNFVWRGRESE